MASTIEEVVESAAEPQSGDKTQQNPFGFFSSFVCKSILLVVIVFFLPLFPSQAPDFISRSILSRGWELIHLLLVGIAVSYGLFSRRNADDNPEKDAMKQKPEVSQSYVAQVLQVPSVFADDEEGEVSTRAATVVYGSKAQMWNSTYYKREPTVVVTPENGNERDEVSKLLFLPVRSLKSNISDEEPVRTYRMFDRGVPDKRNGSRSASRLGENDHLGTKKLLATEEERVVLPSPIPWRSRSVRTEVKGEVATVPNSSPPDFVSSSSSSPPASVARTQSFQSRRTRRASPSPSTSPSRDLGGQNSEDLVKKKSSHKPSSNIPPPPPPPPPPHHFFIQRSQYGPVNNKIKNQVKRSFTDELKVMSGSGGREAMEAPKISAIEGKFREQNPRPPLAPVVAPKNHAEKKSGLTRKFIIDSTSEDDSDSDRASLSCTDGEEEEEEEEEEASINSVVEEEQETTDANEVDKKADEFIAKFREQIRLQRIESIKRSTVQKRGNKGSNE